MGLSAAANAHRISLSLVLTEVLPLVRAYPPSVTAWFFHLVNHTRQIVISSGDEMLDLLRMGGLLLAGSYVLHGKLKIPGHW